jgi:DNA-3-methyladenine glycosylase II
MKCSYRKAEYITDLAAKVASGQLDLEGLMTKSDEEAGRTLVGIRGVGPWTVQWLLIRALGRTDGFPDDDLALLRTLGHLFGDGFPVTKAEALGASRRWAPFRSYVTTYLFAAARSGRLP